MTSQDAEAYARFCDGDAAAEAGDFERARRCFEAGAALGYEPCLTRLADLYDAGAGVIADKREAMRLYRLAWRQRSTVAANNIAILYRERGDRRSMFRWFKRCAEAGDGDALLNMARCYLDGVGVRRNLAEARRCVAAAWGSNAFDEDIEALEALVAETS